MAAKVKWSSAVVTRVGRAALVLAQQHEAVLAPRLAAGLVDGLSADLDVFEGKRAQVPVARETLRSATQAQNEVAKQAQTFLVAARAAIIRSGASASQRAGFGLKLPVEPRRVASVVAALEAFLGGAAQAPEATRTAGLLTADLAEAQRLLASLLSADATQETKKETRKESTAERNQAQARIERAIDSIIGAARIAFLSRPDVTARFVALVPSSPRKPRAAP